jgi:hypothetical protein
MKKMLTLSTAFLISFCAFAQSFSGQWYGMLKAGGSQLRLTMDVTQTDAGYTGKLISVDQGNTQLPFEWFKTDGNNIHLKTTIANIEYKGTLKDETITGVFVQGGQAIPLILPGKNWRSSCPHVRRNPNHRSLTNLRTSHLRIRGTIFP